MKVYPSMANNNGHHRRWSTCPDDTGRHHNNSSATGTAMMHVAQHHRRRVKATPATNKQQHQHHLLLLIVLLSSSLFFNILIHQYYLPSSTTMIVALSGDSNSNNRRRIGAPPPPLMPNNNSNNIIATNSNQTVTMIRPINNNGSNNNNDMIRYSSNRRKKPTPITPDWVTEYFHWHAKQRKRMALLHDQEQQHQHDKNASSPPSREHDHGEFKYLVVRCLVQDHQCGGFADRLRPIVLALYLAHKTQRILLIKWERPAPLEDFLRVPTDVAGVDEDDQQQLPALDWTIPSWLDEDTPTTTTTTSFTYKSEAYFRDIEQDVPKLLGFGEVGDSKKNNTTNATTTTPPPPTMIDFHYQAYHKASQYYNSHVAVAGTALAAGSSATYDDVLRLVWPRMFEPVPAIQSLIQQQQEKFIMPMQPPQQPIRLGGRGASSDAQIIMSQLSSTSSSNNGDSYHYVASHARTQYVKALTHDQLYKQVVNAIHCAVAFLPPILTTTTTMAEAPKLLFVSDNVEANTIAVEYGRGRIVSSTTTTTNNNKNDATQQQQQQQPLHLDRGLAYYAGRHETNKWTWSNHSIEAYYSIFVDFYLLMQSTCLTYDRGGYGSFAYVLADTACKQKTKVRKCSNDNIDWFVMMNQKKNASSSKL